MARTPASAAHAVGFRASETRDPWTGQPLPVVFYYPAPAEGHGAPAQVESFRVDAERDAPVAGGRFPLVVVSHGHMGSMWEHHDLCEALARTGFIVAAPEHIGDTVRDQSAFRTDRMMLGRAHQASAAIDAALADAALSPHVDASRIGAAGFSAGGYTSLLLVGAEPDFARLRGYCERHPSDGELCGHGDIARTRASPPPTRDPRVRAAFVIGPIGIYFGPGAFAGVTAPVFLCWASGDQVLLPQENAEPVRQGLRTLTGTRSVERAGHYVFVLPCTAERAASAPFLCEDPPGVDRAAVHAQVAADAVAFFGATLRAPRAM
jgi:predicted dienelactone hydrolase